MRLVQILLGSLILFVLPGCGTKITFAKVTGKVTIDGKALPNVVVRFLPDAQKESITPVSEGFTDEQGNYSLRCLTPTAEGAVVGKHRVVVEDPNEDRPPQGQPPRKRPRFPAAYSNQARTPLIKDVKSGEQTINLELQSNGQ